MGRVVLTYMVNVAPSVSLTAPTNSASFTAPASIEMTATALDADGTVMNVGFYNGATLLGSDTSSSCTYTWTNVATGSYNLTARATDNNGSVSTSAVVAVTVVDAVATYALTVNSGTGDGSYTNGQQVAISADAPASGKVFDQWIGATQYVASASSASTTVTMPAQAIALTATYADALYALTVNSGTGDGSYTNGQQVAISATVISGKTFVAWTGSTQYVASVGSASTTVTMPAQAIDLTATYTDTAYLYLYQPNFPANGTSSNSVGLTGAASNLLSVAGWKAHYTVNGTAQSTTQSQTNEFVQGAVALLTQVSVSGNVMRNTNVLLWTENFAVTNVDVQKLSEVMFYQQNTVTTTKPRLALRIGGAWYASVTVYSNQVANAMERTTLTAANLAAMNFYSLTFVSGSSLVLGSSPVAFSTLSGAVDAAGLYYDTTSTSASSAYVRLREFTVQVTSVYTLTVNGGGGGGAYTNGQQVTLSASNAPSGKAFDKWIGDTQYLASASSASTTVTMPAQAIALTATYVDVQYTLTVNSGTGDGSYTNGTVVAISADVIAQNIFAAWTGDTQVVASVTASNTTVTMPTRAITLTATYTDAAVYHLLTTSAGTNGAVSPTNAIVLAGNSTNFVITASNYYRIATLTTNGTAVTGMSFDNNSTTTNFIWSNVQTSGVLAATFTAQVTTNAPASVPYEWLAQYGLTNYNTDATNDVDLDGLTAWQEYIAGTVPTNGTSVLKAAQTTRNVITWSAVSGRVYSVYWSTNLLKGFQSLETNIPYTQSSYTNANPDSRVNHYQIRVRMQ